MNELMNIYINKCVGLLHVGDVIKEVNGQEVTNPDQLQDVMKKSNGNITLKILPTQRDQNAIAQVRIAAVTEFHST